MNLKNMILNWLNEIFKNKIKNHLKEGDLFLLDCFNPNIHYIIECKKEQKVIAEYTTHDRREVVIKQSMRYDNATQVNSIEWHSFINGKFHSIQNLDIRLYFPQELDSYLKYAAFNIIHEFGGFEK